MTAKLRKVEGKTKEFILFFPRHSNFDEVGGTLKQRGKHKLAKVEYNYLTTEV
jgi:hypothetical protein